MPALATNKGEIALVYGIGDSLLFRVSYDQGASFGAANLIATLPGLNASATRGPQIVYTKNGCSVIASAESGSIFSFSQNADGKWMPAVKVSDADSVDLEGFVALASNGVNKLFAVWPDLRKDGHNKLFGSTSTDGGRSWSKNQLIYASPDSTICQCCRQNIVMDGDNVFIMFRNWVDGNRDLYLIKSNDFGNTFTPPAKLGMQSWALNGCPMDGGSLVLDNHMKPETVWNRKGTIYASEPGQVERPVGQGRSGTMANVNGKNVYSWVENKQVIFLDAQGNKKNLGQGQLPVLKALHDNKVICVWEFEKVLRYTLINL